MTKTYEELNTRTYKLIDKEGFLNNDELNFDVVGDIGFDTKGEVNLFTGVLETRDTDNYGCLYVEGCTWVTAYELDNYFEEVVGGVEAGSLLVVVKNLLKW